MKLFIHLLNSIEDLETIQNSLRLFDNSVHIDNGSILVTTSTLAPRDMDMSDNSILLATQTKVKMFLDAVNGAAKLKNITFPQIAYKTISYETADGKREFIPNFCEINVDIPLIFGAPPDISKLVALCGENEAVSKALRLYAHDIDWTNLFRIYEIMREHEYNFSGFTKETINAFRVSANRSSISGDLARHGKLKHKGEAPKDTMKILAAQKFIKQSLKGWTRDIITKDSKG